MARWSGSNYKPKSTKAKIFWAPTEGRWAVQTPFSAAFVDELKLHAGRTKRWEPQLKLWLVDDEHIESVKKVVEKYFGMFEFSDKAPPPQDNVSLNGAGPYKDFIEALGYDLCNMVYRKAVATMHPDLGGDSDRMSKLNSAWSSIRDHLK